ncbi:MAG: hypothetical protein KDA32_00900 [Phycisphaerales bacterium]|nr:hypothetical protein [Phycisphaerales bacterium]
MKVNLKLLAVATIGVSGGLIAAGAWQSNANRTEMSAHEALGAWLLLSPRQMESLAEVDADFDAQRATLEAELARERERLATMFEDMSASDEDIQGQVEKVIVAHDKLERHIAGYLLAIRPHLTDAQRATLFIRCARGVREAGGYRWRHGAAGAGAGRGPGGRRSGRGHGPP